MRIKLSRESRRVYNRNLVATEQITNLLRMSTLLGVLRIVWNVFGLELFVQLITDCPGRVVPHALLEDEVLDNTLGLSIAGDAPTLLCEDFQALTESVSAISHSPRQSTHLHSVKLHASLDSQSATNFWRLTAHVDFRRAYANNFAWLALAVEFPEVDKIGVLVAKTLVQVLIVFIDSQRLEGLFVRTKDSVNNSQGADVTIYSRCKGGVNLLVVVQCGLQERLQPWC